MLHNEKGFSLVQVIVAAGLLGGLSLFFMQLVENMGQAQNFAQSKSDEVELKSSIRMILSDEKFCRVSLAGNGPSGLPSSPVVFKKQDIDDEDTEGLDIAFYLSNQAGDTRTLKKFNGANNPGVSDKSKFGKLTIKTMKLIMNNGVGSNYSDSPAHNDIGVIRVITEKKVSSTQTRDIIMDFDVNVAMTTGQVPENSGETRILTCLNSKSSQLVVESGFDVVPDECSGGSKTNYDGSFFCDTGNPSRRIVFNQPFSAPPAVIVTIAGPSANSSLLSCTGGAMDQVGHTFSNVTNSGFDGDAWMSPASTSTCDPHNHKRGPIMFNWYAIGYR